MEDSDEVNISEGESQKYCWIKLFLISSVIFIPIILFGFVRTKAGCYPQGFMCFPTPEFIISIIGYVLSILVTITGYVVEFVRSRVHNNAESSAQANASLIRMYAFVFFISLYRFIVHLETVIDYATDGFAWNGQVLSLPFDIAIIITLTIFAYKIIRNWNSLVVNTSKSLLYSCIILIMINAMLALVEFYLIYRLIFHWGE
ncbi:MAG: hypothetical protein WCK16_02040 [Candidatus Moraniibacteriota bacterium]